MEVNGELLGEQVAEGLSGGTCELQDPPSVPEAPPLQVGSQEPRSTSSQTVGTSWQTHHFKKLQKSVNRLRTYVYQAPRDLAACITSFII